MEVLQIIFQNNGILYHRTDTEDKIVLKLIRNNEIFGFLHYTKETHMYDLYVKDKKDITDFRYIQTENVNEILRDLDLSIMGIKDCMDGMRRTRSVEQFIFGC
jgi:hypothetical protein